MAESGTSVQDPEIANREFGTGGTVGSITLKDKTTNKVDISAHSDITSDYKITLPAAIGSADEVLKIASVSGTNAVCEWGAGGGGGSALTIEDEGSALTTPATTLNFVGSGVTASGTGADKTITIAGTDTNTTYTQTWQDSGDNAILRLTASGSGSGNNDLRLVAGDNITLTPNNNDLTIASSGGGGGGGSGIVNNRIDGDLTIGEDDSEMLTIASKLHIPGGESGQVLTKGTDGSIEYGPTAFDSVNLPGMSNSEHLLCRNITTGTTNTQQFASNTSTYFDFNTVTDENGNPSNTNGTITLPNGNKTLFQNKSGHTLTYIIDLFCHEQSLGNGFNYFELWANVSSDINTIPDINTSSKNRLHFHEDSDEPSRISFNCIISVPNNYYLHILGKAKNGTINIGWGNTSTRHDLYTTIDIVALYNRSNTFTTANPLLANPSTADKGKIVTVNSAGDDLQYGPEFIEVETVYAHLQPVYDGSVNTNFDNGIVTYRPISIGPPLGLTSYSVGGITLDSNNQGIKFPSKGDYKMDFNINIRTTSSTATEFVGRLYKGSSFIQETNTFVRQVQGTTYETLSLTAIIKVEDYTTEVYYFKVFAYGATGNIWGWESQHGTTVRGSQVTIFKLSTTGALTSFTQEQALAGAGGTAAFTIGSPNTLYTQPDVTFGTLPNLTDNILHTSGSSGSTGYPQVVSLYGLSGSASWTLTFEFETPQIVTKYRLWPRSENSNQSPRSWELRAANSSSDYNANTYTVLDSISNAAFQGYTGSGLVASDNLSLANEYNLSTIGAYKYYVLHFTANNGNGGGTGLLTMSEIALYGGGFTIPSQIGNSGKTLKTNGTALEWSTPVTGLLPAPVPENKGKIVTVNAAGDDLEYGANFKELACEQTLITNALIISQANVLDKWADLASHNTNNNIHLQMNTETKINVSQNSKVEIKAQISVSHANNSNLHVAIRLGKKVGNTIIWGNSTGTIAEGDTTDEAQTDPKGDVVGNRHPVWKSVNSSQKDDGEPENYLLYNIDACYIDEDPTNGLSGYHDVTYFIRILKLYDLADLYIGMPNNNVNHRTTVPTTLSATEIGSGAITSFTQEQALAGAGGTAAFNVYSSTEITNYPNWNKERAHDDDIYLTSAATSGWATQNGASFPHTLSYEFTSPQIITKYRIWPRYNSADRTQNLKKWELRAAIDKTTYDTYGTYTLLDSQTLPGDDGATGALNGWPTIPLFTSTTTKASIFPNLANEYNLSTIGAYKYYLLYIDDNYGHTTHTALGEWALYGGGFTIPSQVGHSGKTLKTNGTALEWSAPLTGLLPPPVPENKGKIVTVNAAGDDLQYGPQVLKHNLKYKWITETGSFPLVANTPRIHDKMNITITPQTTTSKILLNVRVMGEISAIPWDVVVYLKRTIGSTVVDLLPSSAGGNLDDIALGIFTTQLNNNDTVLEVAQFQHIDEPNTIQEIKYEVVLLTSYDSGSTFYYNRVRLPGNTDAEEQGTSFISAEEKFANDDGVVGALTSFTQEQALAGAGGTLFQSVTSSTILGSAYPLIPAVHNNIIKRNLGENQQTLLVFSNPESGWTPPANVAVSNPFIAYEFAVPQIVTSYRIWHAQDQNSGDYIPKEWELRASADSSTYVASNSNTYTLLDSQTNQSFTLWSTTGQLAASDNLDLSNLYHINTVGAFKYFVLYFKDSNDSNKRLIGVNEWALYGGGFTIPSQIGNTGRLLTTDGTSLGWSTTSALPSVTVPEPTSTNKGRALVSTGDGIEFSDFNSGVSTGFKVYKSGTAFEEVTGGNAVLFDQTTTNVGAGHYDKVTGIYTVPVTGYYNIFANFEKLDVGFSCEKDEDSTGSGSGTWTTWPIWRLSTVNYNLNTCIDLTTGIFTAPCDGYYQANANLRFDGVSNSYILSIFSIDNDTDVQQSGAGFTIEGNYVSTNFHGATISNNFYLNKGQTVRIKSYRSASNTYTLDTKSVWSMHLIEQKSEFVLQKSTNSGTSYTDIKKAKNNLSETLYLNQNDLIRITSDSTNKLTFNQGELNNSFGAHLLNSGNSTSPIPIYGFNAQKNDDHINPNGVITGWSITENSWNFSEPTSNFNTSSGLFTIPISGYYKVCAMLMVFSNNDSSNFRAHIEINGDTTAPYAGSLVDLHDQTHGTINISTIIKLNKNDTIGISGSDNGTIKGDHTSEDTVDTSTFSCFLLASDTQTNTRQMGLSPIVPLHQLGHDQFAEGKTVEIETNNTDTIQQNINISSGDTGLNNSSINPSIKETSYNLSDFSQCLTIYRSSSIEYNVPSTPYEDSQWNNNNDYVKILPIKTDHSGYGWLGNGTFTIDLSKILKNYIGAWNIGIEHNNDVRLKINNETINITGYNDSGPEYRLISVNQKYINVEWMWCDRTEGGNNYDYLRLLFYRLISTPGMEIAEPVMPSITLPTPNSVNSGKVLVSNGSGYALQPNSGYVPVYGFNANLNSDYTTVVNGIINNWSISGNNHFALPSANFNASSGVYTIPISGYYQINAIIRIDNHTANRIYISVNNTTQAVDTTSNNFIFRSNFVSGNGNTYGSGTINTVLKLNINDTISLKTEGQNGTIQNDDTHWSCMLLNTTEVNATPSINIPLPVAAHAGKSLTVNSQGTGLEYGNSGVILQVQHARVTERQTITGNTATDITDTDAHITGLSITFTPKKSSSKILITAMINATTNYITTFGFLRDGSVLATPIPTNTFSSGSILTINPERNNNYYMDNIYIEWLDNATNTNNRTYKAAVCDTGNRTIYINNRHTSDFASFSSMTIYEIAQ